MNSALCCVWFGSFVSFVDQSVCVGIHVLFNDALNTFIYGYMASDIWLRTILVVRKETCCRHIGYSYRVTARVLLYAPSPTQDNTYHGLCYTSRGTLACVSVGDTERESHKGQYC